MFSNDFSTTYVSLNTVLTLNRFIINQRRVILHGELSTKRKRLLYMQLYAHLGLTQRIKFAFIPFILIDSISCHIEWYMWYKE
jgi:hypothetical protein